MMSDLRVSPGVRKIIVLERDGAGKTQPTVLYEKDRTKKKRQTQMIKPVESIVRRVADATAAGAERYAVKHRKSNRKRRDGWMRDATGNAFRAARLGAKRMKLTRWLQM
jgi:hypothetical protein